MNQGRGAWLPAILGGAIGAAVMAAVMVFAVPQLVGPRLVRDAIMRDPEILADGSDALRSQRMAPVLASMRGLIETPFASSWKGSSKPEVTVAYFFDYACGYCRKSNPDIERLLAEDKGLRVVYRELPILGQNSVAAARVSLAASKAGKFAAFHDQLYAAGQLSPEAIAATANKTGISPEQVKDPAIEAELGKNMQLAGQLGATGTPLFVIGDRLINAAVGYDELKRAIAAARKA